MAAPAVVAFLGGALWTPGKERGAVACMWLAILTVPLTFSLKFINEASARRRVTSGHLGVSDIARGHGGDSDRQRMVSQSWKRQAVCGDIRRADSLDHLVLYTATAMEHAHLKLPLTLQAPWCGREVSTSSQSPCW